MTPKVVGSVLKSPDEDQTKSAFKNELSKALGNRTQLQRNTNAKTVETIKEETAVKLRETKEKYNHPKRRSSGIFTKSEKKYNEKDKRRFSGSEIKFIDSNTEYKMATLRPKSPKPLVPAKPEKEESIWDKIGTLGRKKRIKEVQEAEAVQAEGKDSIETPGNPVLPTLSPEEYEMEENEERCMVDQAALDDPKVQELINVLMDWINDELASQRIIVQDLVEDLYDGQILQKLLEKLTGEKLNVPEVTQSEEGQKHKLSIVLQEFNRVLKLPPKSQKKWTVELIHSKNIVAILYLLVALARHFRAPIRMPEHVFIKVIVVQKINGILSPKTVNEAVTSAYDDIGMKCERDAFDTLFDHAPDKLQVVKKSMVTFVNKHLNKINLEVTELESQFSDGVYLILLMGLLEGFFVPLYCFHLTPKEFEQKVHNVGFAFELMEDVGISKPKARPEDIVNLDLKSTLRVLYKLFSKYKDVA
ncbi:Actin binding protein [Oryctes borbonicus]|uniref:Actin binding protein n=1 Tax=Oryctes borbonicus TaxID=1629725 RepID=A0A0T6B079_9SCAR|nr:Actin binding protein [Oryctes borbonicus]